MAPSVCQLGGRFSHCSRPAVDTCQYCGKPFCDAHTYVLEGLDAVCTHKHCVAKLDDVRVHLQYRSRVFERNRAGLCGCESCGPHPSFECSLCTGSFCDSHIQERRYPFREGRIVLERPASVCDWCWNRRKIWRR